MKRFNACLTVEFIYRGFTISEKIFSPKKGWSWTAVFCSFFLWGNAQHNYLDFEGNKHDVTFSFSTGILDTSFTNPAPDSVNGDIYCLKYIRNETALFDHIRMYPLRRLIDVDEYASSLNPKKIRMMLFSTDSVGTEIYLQLGKKGIDLYPEGIYSEFSAFTTKQNEWEEILFNYDGRPTGSKVSSEEISKIELLFNPNSLTNGTFYMEELHGPELNATVGLTQGASEMTFYLEPSFPNPVRGNAVIRYHIARQGMVTLKLYNVLGQEVLTLLNEQKEPGQYQANLDTSSLPTGAYFYVLRTGANSAVQQMLIAESK